MSSSSSSSSSVVSSSSRSSSLRSSSSRSSSSRSSSSSSSLSSSLSSSSVSSSSSSQSSGAVNYPGLALYQAFNEFANVQFGAQRDPLVYTTFGSTLQSPSNYWEYVSETSASIGFRTNLPAESFIEYGTSQSYGQQSERSDRRYATHLHRLTGLVPGTTYHYRVVIEDERGNRVLGANRTITPTAMPTAIRIPQDMPGGPPYRLTTNGATYLVTQDLVANGTVFDLTAANATLDLGGHTIVYNNRAQNISGDWNTYLDNAAFGIRVMGYPNNLRIVNGMVRQGSGNNAGHRDEAIGFNPIYARVGNNFELAGVEMDYGGPQLIGLYLHWGTGDGRIHHNVFRDRGNVVLNRNGAGSRSMIYRAGSTGGGQVYDNLVKRTRQMGLQANQVYNNEIYIDSYSTNSFGIDRSDNALYRNNRIFGTGYHVVAIGWGKGNIYRNNFIHLAGQGPDFRDAEYGNQESLNGFRLTQYEGSTADYSDNLYELNTILIKGGACTGSTCTEARGIQHSADASIRNNVIRDNVIKVDMAANIRQAAAVVTQGLRDRCGTEAPVIWQGNTLISNIANVRMGDYYAAGCNHRFLQNHLVRIGNRNDYYTFVFDVTWALKDHHMIDASFEGGASLNSVRFLNGGQDFHVGWTLNVRVRSSGQAVSGASISAFDVNNQQIAQGTTDANGRFSTVVTQMIRRQGGDEQKTPTRVVATLGGASVQQTISATETTTLELTF